MKAWRLFRINASTDCCAGNIFKKRFHWYLRQTKHRCGGIISYSRSYLTYSSETLCVCVHVKGSVKLSIFAVHLKHMTLTTHCYWGQAAGSWTVRRTEEGSAALFCPLVIRILKVLHGCKSETIPQIIDWNDSNPIWSQFVKKNELKKLNQKGSDLVLFSGTPIILVKLK